MTKYRREPCRDIDLFVQGAASVTDDRQRIREKAVAAFGRERKKLIDYLLLLQYECINEQQFAEKIEGRDIEKGFFLSEEAAAARNGLVIVHMNAEEDVQVIGAVQTGITAQRIHRCHLSRQADTWMLIPGSDHHNNMEVIRQTDEESGNIFRTMNTDIPGAVHFNMTRSGQPYGEGIVFAASHLNSDTIA